MSLGSGCLGALWGDSHPHRAECATALEKAGNRDGLNADSVNRLGGNLTPAGMAIAA